MSESKFQAELIVLLKDEFPGCVVLKNDPNYIQGFPDLLVLHGRRWAALEVKASEKSSHRPNQAYYVDYLDNLSFGCFVYPSNRDQVIDQLRRYFNGR